MDKVKKYIFPGLTILLFFLVFRGWLGGGVLSSGDWPYLFPNAITENVPFSSWDPYLNDGLGQNIIPRAWFNSYALFVLKLANIFSWPVFERVVWFFPYIIISFVASSLLARKLLNENNNMYWIGGIVYSLNSYILLIVSGGQVGVVMAYSFLPLGYLALFKLFDSLSLKQSLIFAFATALITTFDLRVAYMFLFSVLLLIIIEFLAKPNKIVKKAVYYFLIPSFFVFLLHLYWILPLVTMGNSSFQNFSASYILPSSLDFFSFAKLENTISLLHPNWPENIFGKTYFQRPEFLLISLMAFLGLLWVRKEEKERKLKVLAFSLTSIIGAFLAKGINEPFGEVYRILFNNLPGFEMFCDPTKWYMLTAVSFSILIPYSINKVTKRIIFVKSAGFIVPILFIFLWSFIIRDAIVGNIGGTLKPRHIPQSYEQFANFLTRDSSFYRTLWVPHGTTFSYNSTQNPAVSGNLFFNVSSSSAVTSQLNSESAQKILNDASIKYIVVPEDTFGKIFVTDRKYDERVYLDTLQNLRKAPYLKEVAKFNKIVVFEVPNPKGHFWTDSSSLKINYRYLEPTRYEIDVKNAKEDDLIVFSESFDSNWLAKKKNAIGIDSGELIQSSAYDERFNSFKLKSGGDYTLELFYLPQKWVNIGLFVSGATLIIVIITLVHLYKKK